MATEPRQTMAQLRADLAALRRRLAELEAVTTAQQRTVEALRASEERFRSTFEQAAVGIAHVGLDGRWLRVNQRLCDIVGYTRDELLTRTFQDITHPDDLDTDLAGARQLLAGTIPSHSAEKRYFHKNGSVVWINLTVSVAHDPCGVPEYFITVVEDISARKRAEAALHEKDEQLRESEARLRLRLDAILSPNMPVTEDELIGLLDIPTLQTLMEDFSHATGMAVAVLDLKGKILLATGWQDICTQYHRLHPQTAQACMESDLFLSQNVRPSEHVAYKCRNHLWDVVTPLFIGGKHVANIYTGQFFYDDERVEVTPFLRQAAACGFDEDAYLAALQRVPRVSREKVRHLMDFLVRFAALVSGLSHSNLKLAKAISDQKRVEATLRESEDHFRRLIAQSPIPIAIYNDAGDIEYFNDRLTATFGYTRDDVPNLADWWPRAYPDPQYRREVMALWQELTEKAKQPGGEIEPREYRVTCKDGTLCIAEILGTRIGDRNLVILTDVTARKRDEEVLAQSERRLRALIEAAPFGAHEYELTTDNRLVFVGFNAAAGRILGVDHAPFIGQTIEAAFPGLVQTSIPQAYRTVAATGSRYEDVRVDYAEGQIHGAYEISAFQTAPRRMAVLFRDVTDRRRAEDALQREKVFSDAVLDSVPGLLYLYDEQGYLVRWNKKHEEITGYTSEELAHMHLLDWYRGEPEDTARITTGVQKALREGFADAEAHLITKTGARILFYFTAVRLHIAGKTYFTGVGIDLTQRKRAEDALRTSESFLSSVINQSPYPLWVSDSRGTLVRINQACRDMLHVTDEEVVDKYNIFEDSIVAERGFLPLVRRVFEAGETVRFELTYDSARLKNLPLAHPAAVILDVTMFPVRDGQGRIANAVIQHMDITARKRAEEDRAKLEVQLRQAQKMEAVGQLAGGVAHDFNNILTAILGQLDLTRQELRSRLPADDALILGLRMAEESALRAATLTRQLLAFSRRQVAQPIVLDLNRTFADMQKMLSRLLTENIKLELHLAPDLHPIHADIGQVEQVLMNLVVNARDAMPDGGQLVVATADVVLDEAYVGLHADARAGPHVVLSVSDTGCGMDATTLEHVFEPFFTTKPVGQGTGLGLATVYGIVKQAGGHVSVYSEPGHGTTFRVYWPAADASATPPPVPPADSGGLTGTETILLCEDDESVRRLTEQFLQAAGYTVLVAARGSVALARAAEYQGAIDLLVTDVIMPDMNGRKLAEALTTSRPDLRTLFISGYTANVIAHHGVLDPGVEFLEKPFGRRKLLVRVREVLDRQRSAAGAAK